MQRIDPDAGGAHPPRQLDQGQKIGKIAMPPIAPRPDAVELHPQRPPPAGRALECGADGARRHVPAGRVGGRLRRTGSERLHDLLQHRRRNGPPPAERIDIIHLDAEPGGLRA